MATAAKTGRLKRFASWIDERYPMTSTWEQHLSKYYAPKNFNFWYFFGSLALVVLVAQILTGIFLTMHYKPDTSLAFASVEYIMRDVDWGWLIRYMHSTGASLFFIVVYLHMFRAFLYGSHRGPRELLWIIGVVIFIALMAEAFMGYLLPWGNMSYWGAQVIISLFDAIPVVGPDLAEWIRGDFVVSDATLNRFFSLHVIAVPLVLVMLAFIHLVALHKVGSNNPDGIEIKKKKDASGIPLDGIPFHPYYTVKDIVGTAVFLMIGAAILFFFPEVWGWFLEHDNFVPANILQTPTEIKPLWYFTPFYSILRATTEDMVGFRLMPIVVVFVALLMTDMRGMTSRIVTLLIAGVSIFLVFVIAVALVFNTPILSAGNWGLALIVVSLSYFFVSPWFSGARERSVRHLVGVTIFVVSVATLFYMYFAENAEQMTQLRFYPFLGIVLAAVISGSGSLSRRALALIIGAVLLLGMVTLEAKVWGVVLMGSSLATLFLVPWLDRSPVKSIRYRGWMFKTALGIFTTAFLVLGYLGTRPASGMAIVIAQTGTILYFLFFLLMPWYTTFDKVTAAPERVTK